ncbi:PilW family protein [Enterobacterales bacterium AE_CKDN230030158-1A_HGKHYDSX7]
MNSAHLQRGFTLVELMVAVTISLLLMVAILSLYLNLSRANDDMAKTNSLIENGRFAVGLLQEDFAHAGFWNGHVPQFDDLTAIDIPGDVPTDLAPVCADFSTWTAQDRINAVGVAVQVYSGVPGGCSSIITGLAANSDVVVIRHAETCAPGVGNCEALTPGRVYFQSSFCDSELANTFVLDTGGFLLHQRDCITLAERRRFVTNVYYVRTFAVTAGDGIPTLMRAQFDSSGGVSPSNGLQAAMPLIEGVEAFRVELGVDNLSDTGAAVNYSQPVSWADNTTKTSPTNRGDGSPDGSFVHCGAASCTTAELTNVVEARLYVLARSRTTTPGYTSSKTYALGAATLGPFTDSYKRHLFTSSATLVNVSRRRQTP